VTPASATLSALLRDVREYVLAPEGAPATVGITAIEYDSRRVGPGALFCCLPGEHADGHDHAGEAAERGAVALLVERRLPVDRPQVVVPDAREAMGLVASTFHGHPSRSLEVVGITGTNGKTTVAHLLGTVLDHAGRPTGVLGTLTGTRTTPESPELQARLADLLATGHRAVAMEVSSHAIALHRIAGTWFRVAVFTNLSQDHLDFHETMDRYFAAKTRLFEPDRAALALINAGDPWGRRLLDNVAIPAQAWSPDDAHDPVLTPEGSTFRWRGVPVRLALAGRFNLANAVAAAEAALALGLEPEQVAAGLAEARPVSGRFQPVEGTRGYSVLVDYAHTPEGLVQALASARELARRRVIVVFGSGGDRDRDKRPLMGRAADEGADLVVVTSDNPRTESAEAIIEEILEGVDRDHDLVVEVDRRRAIEHAVGVARPGDVVVVAGKGHEDTQDLGDRVVPFDDRQVATEAVRQRAATERGVSA
jgi:UDP-N-acetylmuramoyl-L-alanyl-D-glutamate--2,6-diaminopimelate ligase